MTRVGEAPTSLNTHTRLSHRFELSGIKSLLDSALDGFSSTVFAYGQTGSGKTYTMTGIDEKVDSPAVPGGVGAAEGESMLFDGIIPRSLRYIFDQIRQNERKSYIIRASFLEIYNEQVRQQSLSRSPPRQASSRLRIERYARARDWG